MINKIIKNNKGTTLLEMIVALGIFSVFILSAAAIFQLIVGSQRSAFASQNMQESMRYALEVMAREIRMAQKPAGGCGSLADVYETNVSNGQLYLKNKDGQCVIYFVDADNRLRISRDGGSTSDFITPDEVKVDNISFKIYDTGNVQPKVVLMMDLEVIGKELHKQKMKIQTTISSRYYE